MTFILKKPETFVIEEVPVTVPGQQKPGTMRVEYIYRTQTEYDEWFKASRGLPHDEAASQYIKSWGNCRDAEGNEIPFSPESVRLITDCSPSFPHDLFMGYCKGLFESRVKN